MAWACAADSAADPNTLRQEIQRHEALATGITRGVLMRRFITDGEGLPRWASPISHAVVVDNICYLSGQLSMGEDGIYVPGTAREEAVRAFNNLFSALHAAEFSVSDLTFIDIALADLGDIGEVNELYAELFPVGHRPARTVYQAAALPYGGRVKVTGVAIKERAVG